MMIRDLIKSIASPLPYRFSQWLAKPRIVAAFYHTICSIPPKHIRHLYPVVTPKQFEKDLDFFLRYCQPTDLKEYVQNPTSYNKSKPRLLLSFDDGFREIFSLAAPILKSKGIPATIFVNPFFVDNKDMLYRCKISLIIDKVQSFGSSVKLPSEAVPYFEKTIIPTPKFIDWLKKLEYPQIELIDKLASEMGVDFGEYLKSQKPYLSLDEINLLANDGFAIGAHSMDHPNFANILLEEQIAQVNQSVRWVQTNIANQPKAFSFPFSNDGVSASFFSHFLNEKPDLCDIFFGTSGYKPTNTPKFIHRIPLEESGKSAKQIVKGELNYYIFKKILNKHKVKIQQ